MVRSIGLAAGMTLFLAACGGGGNEGGTTSAPSTIPVAIAASPAPVAGIVTNPYPGYAFILEGAGALSPWTWTVTTGALPGGLALSPDGVLSGTPTTAGSFTFTVTATYGGQPPASASQSFTVNITNPPLPVLTAGQTPNPAIHGSTYAFAFAATGGFLPLTYAVTQGALPPGLTLGADGWLTGTPSMASATPYAFTVTVTDSKTPAPASDSATYSITVSEPPAPTINNTLPPTATVGSPYSFTFTARDGLAPLVWTPPAEPMGGLVLMPDGSLSGTPSATGIYPITLAVTDALNQASAPAPFTLRIAMARPPASFWLAGAMSEARVAHTATLLQGGRVLIAGGTGGTFTSFTAELYDPMTRAFTVTGPMTAARTGHTATLLADPGLPNHGKVLVVGGTGGQTAELYDPATGTFQATGNTVARHLGQTATLLKDGQVLVAGGETASAELFDPGTGRFTATGSLTVSRTWHTATLLPDGRVLIAGGMQDVGPVQPVPILVGVSSAEIYDPVSGTFTATGSMSSARVQHTATLLADGTVLVADGGGTADVFSPAAGSFSPVGAPSTGYLATATLRNDGTVLMAGGRRTDSLRTALLFAPECAGFVSTGPLLVPRDGHTATLLADGSVLVTGGSSRTRRCCIYCGRGCAVSNTVLSSAELFQ